LVRSRRKIAAGRADYPLIAREFKQLCGEDAAEVLATFGTFLRALAYAGRNRLIIGYPGCAAPTADERQCLMLIAAAQTGDEVRFEAHLRWLARAERRPALEISAYALATAIEVHDLQLQPSVPTVPFIGRRIAVGD
jgi:hypothetical protein